MSDQLIADFQAKLDLLRETAALRKKYEELEHQIKEEIDYVVRPKLDEKIAEAVMALACAECAVTYEQAWNRRSRRVFPARRLAWLVLRELDFSFPKIARLTRADGFKWDHSTIMHAIKTADDEERELAKRLAERMRNNDRESESGA